jgi:hypothetical protein
LPATRVAANTGVCGGVSWSSNASLCDFVIERNDTWFDPFEAVHVEDAGDADEAGAVGAMGVVLIGENGALVCGEAPSRPIIDGSR